MDIKKIIDNAEAFFNENMDSWMEELGDRMKRILDDKETQLNEIRAKLSDLGKSIEYFKKPIHAHENLRHLFMSVIDVPDKWNYFDRCVKETRNGKIQYHEYLSVNLASSGLMLFQDKQCEIKLKAEKRYRFILAIMEEDDETRNETEKESEG